MISTKEFVKFVENLENSVIQIDHNLSKATYRSINLKILVKDIEEYETFPEWWNAKGLSNDLAKVLIKAGPAENIKCALLFVML